MSENFLKSLVQYIRNNISTITFYPGHWYEGERSVPCALILEAGGTRPFHAYYSHFVTVTVEDDSFMDCRDHAYTIHDLLLDGKGVTLPAVVTGDSAIQAEVIEVLGIPQSLGQNERGIYSFVFNFVVRR